MSHSHRRATLATLCAAALLSGSIAQGQRALPRQAATPLVPPLLDDANLNDVQFVGQRRGWAVGDRGVIWRTDDGGETWQLQASGVDDHLTSVCFLTDRVGWVVGGRTRAHTHASRGVVLSTTDGGDTWTQLVNGELPRLCTVRFFDLDEGMAVCEANARYPSGVIQTTDGGQTWQPLKGPAGDDWRVGDFVDQDMGFVAGRLGRFTSVGGGQVMPPLTGAAGLRGIADVALSAEGRGWLAGDGGLILTTQNGGVSWRPPDGQLPRQLRDVMDFQAVAMHGVHVWLAGTPGSVVWHSPDGGQTWNSAPTGQTAPITALDFTSETTGWAAGALGTILRTEDGGRTWTASRGGQRRAAILALHAHTSRVSLNLITKYGGDQAYRTAAILMSRRDIGPDGSEGLTLDRRLHDAVASAGGSAATIDWAFPVAAPELDQHQRELIREWQLLTDNRLREVMLSRLVVLLRTWRPDVLILDTPPEDDATTKLLADAVKLAVTETGAAADPTLSSLLHLPAWRVGRAFRRLPAGSEGDVAIEAFEFLPRQGASVAMAAAGAVGLLGVKTANETDREAYEVWPLEGTSNETPGRDFFAGLVLQPGGPARRQLAEIDDRHLEQRQNLANQQRNFAAYTRSHLDDERHAAQIIGQTREIVGTAPPGQAAVQLMQLAEEYRQLGQWEHAQTTLFEVAERFPGEPVALDAMRWLFLFTSSAEVSWQRLRASSTAERTQIRIDENIVQANVRSAIDQARSGNDSTGNPFQPGSPIQQASGSGTVRMGNGVDQHAARLEQWQSQAARLAELIERTDPAYFAEPSIQFPLAALERSLKHPREADRIVAALLGTAESTNPWNQIAAGEVWISQPSTAAPGAVVVCHRTAEAPYLDGQLDEVCWQRAIKVPLRGDGEHGQPIPPEELLDGRHPYVQLAYDAQYLYVAARLPRSSSVKMSQVEQPGRVDDADLTGQDRLSLQFDVDRDYATYYRIDVDQRGWTADACWDNDHWNAQRFIAVQGPSHEWVLEMVIPHSELVAEAPRSGETWAAGIVRILPTVGIESWSTPAGTDPQPEGFGLLRFE